MAQARSFLSFHSLSFSAPAHRLRSEFFLRPKSLRSEFAKIGASLPGSIAAGDGASIGKLRGNEDDFRSSDDVAFGSTYKESVQEKDSVPTPVVMIDQDSDPDATIVWLSFGDRLGALLDTMQALRNLGLDVTKGTVAATEDSVIKTEFFISQHGRKVNDPAMLENIRLTIIDNLLKFHPESSERLAMGEVFGIIPPKKLDVDASTLVHVEDDGPKQSLLYIETVDRPGLLLEITKIVTDISVDVKSAEISTEGLVVKDKFHVSYRGAALPATISQVLVNTLRYYLGRPETEEDSY